MNASKLGSRRILQSLGGVALLSAAALGMLNDTAVAAENSFPVPVSINALMVTLIDHSAHYIWDYGVMQREITDDEWRTIEYYAIQLAGSGPLITLGGSGPMDDTWVESELWRAYSKNMSDAAVLAL